MFKNVPFRTRTGVLALTLALTAGAGALAVNAVAAGDPPAGPGMMHRDFEAMRVKHLSDELGLNPQQTVLAKAAIDKMHPSREAEAQMKKEHEARLVALMDPNFDPRRAAAEDDAHHAAMEAHKKDARDAWFALWDTLNADQRVKARLMLVKMAENHHEGHFGHHEGEGMHGPDGMHGGPQGGPYGGPNGATAPPAPQ